MTEPEEKPLQATSFIVHATRGVIRDQTMRRKMMFLLIIVALVLLLAGLAFLQAPLNPRAHPVWFILFWIVCGWLTFTALLLAVFDLLMVKVGARRIEKNLREKFARSQTQSPPEARTPNHPESAEPFEIDK